MTGPLKIRGMAWDHPRATNPLSAISAGWAWESGIAVVWDARPLKAFEDQPPEPLAGNYDPILIDHPFVGFAATSGLIVPAYEWVDPPYWLTRPRTARAKLSLLHLERKTLGPRD
jgi:hypothetical protein